MLRRLVRIQLSLGIDGFQRATHKARLSFLGFLTNIVKGVAIAGAGVGVLTAGFNLAARAAQTMIGIAKKLADTFLFSAVATENNALALKNLIGNADEAADVFAFLDDQATEFGIATAPKLEAATLAIARAMREMSGEVDPDDLQRWVVLLERASAANPDIPIERLSAAIAQATKGKPDTLFALLGIDADTLEGMSEKTRAFFQSLEGGKDQALGTVTRLAGDAEKNVEGALDAFDEVLALTGAGTDALQEFGDSAAGEMGKVRAELQETAEEFSKNFLPAFAEALQELNTFFTENEEAIKDFAASLGDAFGNLTVEGVTTFFDELAEFDLSNLADDLIAIVNSLEKIVGFLALLPRGLKTGGEILNLAEKGVVASGGVDRGAGAGLRTRESFDLDNDDPRSRERVETGDADSPLVRDFIKAITSFFAGGGPIPRGGSQEMKITVGVDPDAQLNIKTVAAGETNKGLNEVLGALGERR